MDFGPCKVIFAEIADKLTAREDLWIIPFQIGCCLTVITVGSALAKLRAGWVGVGIALLFGIFMAGDTSMDEHIQRELGKSYLILRKLSVFIPFFMTSIAVFLVWIFSRRIKSANQ